MQELLQLLNQISDELNKDLDLDKMLQRVIDLTVEHFKATNGSIMLFDDRNRVSKYILQRKDISQNQAHKIVGQVMSKGFAGWVFNHRRGDIITDTMTDARWLTYPDQPYTVRSVLATPLMRRDHILGILTINHNTQPNHFKRQDLSLLNAIAGQAAIALENAQLFKQKEKERATLSAIINSSKDVIIVTYDQENKVLLLNPAAENLLHTPAASQWQDQPLDRITSRPDIIDLAASAPVTNTNVELSDGRTMLAGTVDVPEVGRLILMHDISALKALDKMKGEFITTFTHDLAAPLAAIKGHIQLMQIDGTLTPRQMEDLDCIRMSVEQMSNLIKDLLELTKLESLKDFFKCDVQLKDTVKKTCQTFQPVATAKSIDLTLLETDFEQITTQGNPTLIARAVDNLVENAIKYTRPQGKITMSLTRDNKEAHISVKDTGVGITQANLPRVFNKFFRVNPPGDNEIPGSGLGLSIVKAIVDRHSGRVEVDSEVNVGSTFTISLPLNNGKHA